MNVSSAFINRERELSRLAELYAIERSSFVVLYGRRRLGKTTLIRQFAHNLPHVYYMADQAAETDARRSLAIVMAENLAEPTLATAEYQSWYDLFAAFDRFRPRDKKTVFILDEYQCLCQAQPAFSSFIQKWWDEHWRIDTSIMLILCGSAMSMMYRETLAEGSPLFGRADARLLLHPLCFQHLSEFFPNATPDELVEIFAICGGVPRYLELYPSGRSFEQALKKLVLQQGAPLYSEARFLLQEEVSAPNTFWSILHALGQSVSRISELGSRLQLPANQLTRYLSVLRDLKLVQRDVPVLEKNPIKSKKGVYLLTDSLLALWFGVIYPYESFLEFGEPDRVLNRIRALLQRHIARIFEQVCQQYCEDKAEQFGCLKIGRQWNRHYELDIAGVNEQGLLTLVGECKWSRNPVGVDVLNKLRNTVTEQKLPTHKNCAYLLFSKSGFTSELQDTAQESTAVQLIHDITNKNFCANNPHPIINED